MEHAGCADINDLKARSDAGDALAMAEYGWRKIHADGCELDREGGARLCHASANLKNPKGQFNCGFCLFNGLGIDEDQSEGFKYFKLSADQGYGPALYQVAVCYEHGMGVAADKEKARQFYKMAEDAGFNPVGAI